MELVELAKRIFKSASYIFLHTNEKKGIYVACTGSASIKLRRGTTAHRAAKLPIEIDSYSNVI